MPRGIKGSGKAGAVSAVETVTPEASEAKDVAISEAKLAPAKVRVTPEQMRAMEAVAHLRDKPTGKELPKLESDQQYFEAPDGTVMVGQKSDQRMWYRNLHGQGKGGWILPRR